MPAAPCTLLALALAAWTSAQDAPDLLLGAELTSVLAQGQTAADFRFAVESAGPVTVAAESHSIDVDLAVLQDGQELGRTTAGGLGTDARATFPAEPGSYVLRVTTPGDAGGPFRVRLTAGEEELPTGQALLSAQLGYWERSVAAARAAADGKRELYALSLAGQWAFQLNRLHASYDWLESAARLAREQQQRGSYGFARIYMGLVRSRQSRFAESIELLTSGREALRNQSQLDPVARQALGDAHLARGELEQAEGYFMSIAREAADQGRPVAESDAMGRLARLARAKGNVDEADELYASRLDKVAADPRALCLALMDQASFYSDELGELYLARATLATALERADSDALLGDVHGELGQLELRDGRLSAAREHFLQAHDLSRAAGKAHSQALALLGLAQLARAVGDAHTAVAQLQEALALEAGHDVDVQLWGEMGILKSDAGELDAALEAHDTAYRLASEAGLIVFAARAQGNIAEIERQRGNMDHASGAAAQALSVAEAYELEDLAALAKVNLAYIELHAGQAQAAWDHASQAYDVLARRARRDALHAPLETMARAALDLDQPALAWQKIQEAFDAVDTSQGSLAEVAGSRARSAWWAEVLVQDLTALALQDLEGPARDDCIARGLGLIGAWRDRALRERRRGAPLGWEDARVDVARLRSVLPTDAILIELAPGAETLYAYALDARQADFVELGPRAPIEAKAAAFADDIAARAPLSKVHARGAELYELLIAPVLRTLDKAPRTILIGPSPELARVPFEALVVESEAGEPVFAIERYTLLQGLTAPLLVELASRPAPQRPRTGLLLGDPVYASEASTPTANDSNKTSSGLRDPYGFERLPGTRTEVLAIADTLSRDSDGSHAGRLAQLETQRSGSLETDAYTLCLGRDVTVERLLAECTRHTFLHIGSHGFVDAHDPLRNGLAMSFEPEGGGFFSAQDVVALDLDLELVVLSACSTGGGTVQRGEGVQSLARAFLQAGSRAVVASLWDVPDKETSLLMRDFHTLWLREGLHPARALRRAKLNQRFRKPNEGGPGAAGSRGVPLRAPHSLPPSHPCFWAACTYTGRPPQASGD